MNSKVPLISDKRMSLRVESGNQAFMAVLIMMTMFSFFFSQGANSQSTEYELKAVAFQKLSLFIEWPGNAFENSGNEFIIGVLGENPFGNLLESVYENVKIKDKKVKTVYFRNIEQAGKCHLLFIPKTSFKDLARIVDFIGTKPVLTIADSEGFAEAGCLINFYSYSGKLRFEVNQKALLAAGFITDFKLLKVSKIVNPAGR